MPLLPASSRSGATGAQGTTSIVASSLSSPATTITASPILTGFSAIEIVYGSIASSAAAVTDTLLIRFNGDAGASQYGASIAGFQSSFQLTIPAATINGSRAGGRILIPNYLDASHEIECAGHHTARNGNAGTTADFATALPWSGVYGTGAHSPISSVTFALTTGPNFVTGGYINVYGWA